MKEDYWLSVGDCAARLQLHPEVVRRWLRSGRLQGRKIGKAWRVSPRSLSSLYGDRIESESTQNAAEPVNRLHAQVDRTDDTEGLTWLHVFGSETSKNVDEPRILAVNDASLVRGQRVVVSIPSTAILLSTHVLAGVSARNQWSGAIDSLWVSQRGVAVHVRTAPELVVWMTPNAVRELALRPGKQVTLVFKASTCRVSL